MEYQWISEDTIFSSRGEHMLAYDVELQREQPLVRLNEEIDRYAPGGLRRWKLSPDGRWLLWTKRTVGSEAEDMRAARLDGSQFQIVHIPPPNTVITSFTWEIDSRHWDAGLFRNHWSDFTEAYMRGDVETPGEPPTVARYPSEELFRHELWGAILLRHEALGAPHGLDKLTNNPASNLPGDAQIIEVEQSHGGDKLAWLCRSIVPSPFPQWIGLVSPRLAGPRRQLEIWISTRDGSNMRELGNVVMPTSGDALDSVRWLPSDKKVSFRFHDAILTVPAD